MDVTDEMKAGCAFGVTMWEVPCLKPKDECCMAPVYPYGTDISEITS